MARHKGARISRHGKVRVFVVSKYGGLGGIGRRARKSSGKKFKTRNCLTYWTPKGLRAAHCSARSTTTRGRKYRAAKHEKRLRARSPEY